jgi:hypothetical protein
MCATRASGRINVVPGPSTAARSSGAPAAQAGHGKMLLGAMESPLSHNSLRSLKILRV